MILFKAVAKDFCDYSNVLVQVQNSPKETNVLKTPAESVLSWYLEFAAVICTLSFGTLSPHLQPRPLLSCSQVSDPARFQAPEQRKSKEC